MAALSEDIIRQKCEAEPWVEQAHKIIRFGDVPAWLEGIAAKLPDGTADQADYFQAAETAREIYREQVRSHFNMASGGIKNLISKAHIADMSAKEPWTTADSISALGEGRGVYGFVPDKLRRARDLFPEGSVDYRTLKIAFKRAHAAYFRQEKSMCQSYAKGRGRAEIEALNGKLWHRFHSFSNHPMYSQTSVPNRLLRVCHLNGAYFYESGKATKRAEGWTQFSLKHK